MAAYCRRQEREGSHSNPLKFLREAPKFFKCVVNPRENRLRLPTEFVKRFGQSLPNRVFLNVPNGSVQEVELIRLDGETWLQRGWQEFKEKYLIGFGHVLFFEYDCNFDFNVYIFDVTALEIEYPLDSAYNEGITLENAGGLLLNTEDTESETDNSVVFFEKCLASLYEKGKRKNLLEADQTEDDVSVEILDSPVPRLDKRRTRSKAGDSIEFSDYNPVRKSSMGMQNLLSHTKYDLGVKGSSLDCQSEHTRVKLGTRGTGGQAPERAQRVLNQETCISYQRAKAFKSDNPSLNPFYISLLQQSCIHSPCILSIPMLFAKENLPHGRNNIKLSVSDGKTWLVRCIFRLGNAKISAGWAGFVKSNALKVGDTCIFEVNKSNKLVWNVLIFRS